MKFDDLFHSKLTRYGVSAAAVLLITMLLEAFAGQINSTTVALTLLLIVLFSATFFGRNPALLASFAAMLCFNYFFLPPVRTWTISDPQNLVAWAAFTITAIIAGELSAYARRRAAEAENQRIEIEGLYDELRSAFAKATHTEALKQSEQLKSALLDAVTHDLRTPLTSIKASVTTLLESEGGHRTIELDGESRVEFLDVINEETDRLNNFIEGMVDIARLEAGALNLQQSFSNVEEIISIAHARAERSLSGHRITAALQDELPLIRVDAKAMAEVIYVLLDNAAKYSPAGTLIKVHAVVSVDMVEISVNDQGPGVPAELRKSIFDKFYRSEKATAGGLGLGLAIAKGIVESHGGTIRVVAGDGGVGAKFIVRIPIGD